MEGAANARSNLTRDAREKESHFATKEVGQLPHWKSSRIAQHWYCARARTRPAFACAAPTLAPSAISIYGLI